MYLDAKTEQAGLNKFNPNSENALTRGKLTLATENNTYVLFSVLKHCLRYHFIFSNCN